MRTRLCNKTIQQSSRQLFGTLWFVSDYCVCVCGWGGENCLAFACSTCLEARRGVCAYFRHNLKWPDTVSPGIGNTTGRTDYVTYLAPAADADACSRASRRRAAPPPSPPRCSPHSTWAAEPETRGSALTPNSTREWHGSGVNQKLNPFHQCTRRRVLFHN